MTRRLAALLLLAAATARADGPPADWEYAVTYRGQPVAGAKVGLSESTFGAPGGETARPVRFATTDAKGELRLSRRDGGRMVRARVMARDGVGRGGAGILFDSGKHPPTLELAEPVELMGRVTDAAGKPVPGLKLTPVALGAENFERYGGQPVVQSPTQDWFWEGYAPKLSADGALALRGVPAGHSVGLRFEAPGFGGGTLWVLPGRSADVRLQPAGAVTFRFPAPRDAKPGDVRVKLTRKLDTLSVELTSEGTAKAAAELTLAGLPPGSYGVEFPYPGPAELYPKVVPPVTVRPGETAVVATPLERCVRVSAKLVDARTGKAVAGAGLSAAVQNTPGWQYVPEGKAGADGKVVLSVPAGLVSVTPQGADGYKVVPFAGGPFNETSTRAVPLGPGETHDFGRFGLTRAVDLYGTVVDPEGKPVAGATVQVGYTTTNFPAEYRILTDAKGRFVIKGLSPEGGAVGVTARKGDRLTAAPVVADPYSPGTNVRVVVSERFAARMRARAVDGAGRPVAGATVELVHTMQYLRQGGGGPVGGGSSGPVGVTGPDGRFDSDLLQAGDDYALYFRTPGYRRVTGPTWKAVPGEAHDFGELRFLRADLAVTGTVTDLAGRPVPKALIFDNADGPLPTSTTTDTAGRFSLPGLFAGPACVSVKADGFRVASAHVEAGGKPVTLTLRRPVDPPAPPPVVSAAHLAATAKLTRHLLERMWAGRTAAGDDGRQTLSAMARFDFETARRWAEEEKARPGGADLSGLLDQAGAGRRLADVAREDPDEAVALLKSATGNEGLKTVCRLADGLLPEAPGPALRLAEEAVSRARGIEQTYRPWALAEAGELVFRAGRKDAGRKVLEEAVALAEKLGVDGFDGYNRCQVACRVALYDPAKARRLLGPIKEPEEFNRWLARACGRVAGTDLPLAKRWLGDFRRDNSFARETARQQMAFRLARPAPDEAVALAEGIGDKTVRVITLAGLAARLAPADRARAVRLLDAVLDGIVADPTGFYENDGGGGGTAALVLFRAKEAGHPDLAGARDRALAARSRADDGPFRANYDATVQTALALALTDPDTARTLLQRSAPRERLKDVKSPHVRETVIALALADPDTLDREIDGLVAQVVGARQGYRYGPLEDLARLLTEPDQLPANAARFGGLSREYEEE